MSDRISRADVETRCANLNARMESRGSLYRYSCEGRNGWIALDRYDSEGRAMSNVRCGTKREIAEFLHAMMVALDDAVVKP